MDAEAAGVDTTEMRQFREAVARQVGEQAMHLARGEQPHHRLDGADLSVHGGAVDAQLLGDVLDRGALDAIPREAASRRVEVDVERRGRRLGEAADEAG